MLSLLQEATTCECCGLLGKLQALLACRSFFTASFACLPQQPLDALINAEVGRALERREVLRL
jgi:hypothetical protein